MSVKQSSFLDELGMTNKQARDVIFDREATYKTIVRAGMSDLRHGHQFWGLAEDKFRRVIEGSQDEETIKRAQDGLKILEAFRS